MSKNVTSPPRLQTRPKFRLYATLGLCMAALSAHAAQIRYQPAVEKTAPKTLEYDVAVYGGTPAGVTAAVQAARLGKSAVLISFNGFVGGMTSGGLTASDLGQKDSIGGMALEFYQRVGKMTKFSPSQAEALYRTKLDEAGVTLLLNRPLVSATVESARIVSIDLQTGETVQAKMFVDTTYEGDLLAAANVSYHVGREPSSTYNESLGGQWQEVSWKDTYQFCRLPISPFVEPDDPQSGLLPEIAKEPAGKPGEGDFKVQAYNFRVQMSKAEDRIPFPRPDGYDAGRYALLARFLNFDPEVEWVLNYTVKPMTDGPVQLRPGDSNNAGSFSTDYVGGNYRWPDGTYTPGSFATLPPPRRGLPVPLPKLYEIREKIFQDHINYQMGLYHFLANDPQVPAELRERVKKFGLDPKEFPDTGHWPHQLYIREGRRMVSDYVMTQANCERERIAEDSIGLASYPMDSHFCQRVVVEENGKTTVRNEGGFGHKCKNGPYPVSYRSIVPKKGESENLLVPVSLSSSHVAFGSIRMEPVFMILGQSAGTAASLAIDANQAVQDVPYEKLKELLMKQGQQL
ncbi:MAG: FAD-dependent oxidoreductase [Akkermansiaceae bacterium]|nr:FAD-dependent oxidoreductase [Akkermansiaceae bacterium]